MTPSTRSLLALLVLAPAALAHKSPLLRSRAVAGAPATCNSPQLSCHNTSAVQNLCCFNAPGGSLLQTQFWDTDPVSGPSNSWTIHGLWPDHCDGTFDENCDTRRAYKNISSIIQAFGDTTLLDFMNTFWTSNTGSAESFWEHEWATHGTCISTLDPDCYTNYQPTEEVPDFFQTVVDVFKTVPTFTWLSDAGIVPSTTATYSLSAIESALSKNHGGKTIFVGCDSGVLDEVWYYFNVAGSIQTGTFEPANNDGSPSTCPSTGIRYPPKGGSSSGGGGGGSSPTSTPAPAPSGGSFSGKGFLNVVTSSGDQDGCIISAGTWFTTGTCATFTAAPSGDGFTLTSSKGDCAVSSGKLTCGSGVSPTVFSSSGGDLAFGGSNAFSADSEPTGQTQGTVFSGSGHSVGVTIQWEST